eukprot:134156-Amphidinium_carterae.1
MESKLKPSDDGLVCALPFKRCASTTGMITNAKAFCGHHGINFVGLLVVGPIVTDLIGLMGTVADRGTELWLVACVSNVTKPGIARLLDHPAPGLHAALHIHMVGKIKAPRLMHPDSNRLRQCCISHEVVISQDHGCTAS